MAEIRQKLRGTSAKLDQYVGREGQLCYDSELHEIRVFDGIVQGGYRILNRAATISLIIGTVNADVRVKAYNAARLGSQLPSYYARSARQIIAGNGMTGGGDLTANRTLTLGTPSTITGATGNTVSGTTHTHNLNITVADVPGAAALAGAGFTGPVTFGGAVNAQTGELIVSGAGSPRVRLQSNAAGVNAMWVYTSGGTFYVLYDWNGDGIWEAPYPMTLSTGSSSGSIFGSTMVTAGNIGSYAVPLGRQVKAGNGLTGGGDLTTSRTITLGTPGTITATSGNTVGVSNHTHSIDTGGVVSEGMASRPVGGIGTYGFFFNEVNEDVAPGETRAGSQLTYASTDTSSADTSPAGTWRCMGKTNTGKSAPRRTVWMRIS